MRDILAFAKLIGMVFASFLVIALCCSGIEILIDKIYGDKYEK